MPRPISTFCGSSAVHRTRIQLVGIEDGRTNVLIRMVEKIIERAKNREGQSPFNRRMSHDVGQMVINWPSGGGTGRR